MESASSTQAGNMLMRRSSLNSLIGINAAIGIFLFLGSVVVGGVGLAADDTRTGAWIGVWMAAPQPFMPGALVTFQNQTVRLIAHGSIDGRALRLRFSNTYGHKPITLGAVRVARRSTGADTEPGSERTVRFRGRTRVTIPAGETTTSDPVHLDVSRSTDLAISLYFPDNSPAATSHFLAMQSGYVASERGDQTGLRRFKTGETIDSWPFLTGIDVFTADALGTLAVFGDSTVDGDGSSPDANHRLPDEIARALNNEAGARQIGVLNAGIVGNRLLLGSPRDPPSKFGDALGEAGVLRFERDALASPATHWVIVRLGINDIGMPGSLAPASDAKGAADMINGYKALLETAHKHHVKVYICTLSAFEGADAGPAYYSPEKEAIRQEVNSWIRTGAGFDGVIDLDAILRDPQHPSRLLPTFDSGDHLHPNDAGNAASAVPITRQLLGTE
jgi:lysophospholipase L1-like esterase